MKERKPVKKALSRMLPSGMLKNERARKGAVVVLSAVLSNLSYPELDLFWVQFFSLAPFFYILIREKDTRLFVAWTCLFGAVFYGIMLFWLKVFHPLSLPGIILGYLFYFSVFGFVLKFLLDGFPRLRVLIVPSAWVGLEYFRSIGFLGFPWGLTAHSQWNFLPFIQIADTFGVWIVSFLVVLVNMTVLELFLNRSDRRKVRRIAVLLAVLLAAPVLYGIIRIRMIQREIKGYDLLKVALIQSDVDPNLPSEKIKYRSLSRLTHLSQKACLHEPDLLVWSETAILDYVKYYTDHRERLKAYPALKERLLYARNVLRMAKDLETPIFTGIPHYEKKLVNGKYKEDEYNAAVLIGTDGLIKDVYYKIHLVPFGEWFPYRIFPLNEILAQTWAGHWTPGKRHTVFELLKGERLFHFSGLICYEGIFGDLCRRFALSGAEFFINITNDSWSFTRAAELQHLIADIFRTVETRLPYVRCGNSGATAVINQYGKVVSSLPLFTQDFLVDSVRIGRKPKKTFYVRHGDFFPRILLIFNFSLVFYLAVRKFGPSKG